MFTDTKSLFFSKTVIGAAVSILATGLRFFGVEAGAEEAALTDALYTMAQAGGALLAIYGRLVATTKVTL